METLRVALLQILPAGTLAGNLEKGLASCRQAKAMGADIALFPEMWSNGYSMSEDIAKLKASALPHSSEFVQAYAKLAKELSLAIAITYLEQYDPAPRNSLSLFDRFGSLVFTYAKVHTCDFDAERSLTAGDDFYVGELNTAKGKITVGAMICYDREFPESARLLMLKGAEIILAPNACPMEINRISQLRARAFENMVGIATANYPLGQPDCNGHSTAFDGIAYRPGAFCSRDTLVLEAGEQEGVYIADFPVAEIRDYRSREVHGNAYRRPEKYGLLVSTGVAAPFIREDYRK